MLFSEVIAITRCLQNYAETLDLISCEKSILLFEALRAFKYATLVDLVHCEDESCRSWKQHLADVLLLVLLPPTSLLPSLLIASVFTLPAQFQRPGYEHIQVEQTVLWLDGKRLHGSVARWPDGGGRGRRGLRLLGGAEERGCPG